MASQRYRTLERQCSLPLLLVTAKTLEPGSAWPSALKLAAFLQRLGDLAAWTASSACHPALVDAVKHFQSRHGLTPDGRPGRATVAQLNTPVSHRIQQLSLTMERWRWMRQFPLPNQHDVYLHATPATELFSKTRRDFSHACIRLEKPADLALWILRNQPSDGFGPASRVRHNATQPSVIESISIIGAQERGPSPHLWEP